MDKYLSRSLSLGLSLFRVPVSRSYHWRDAFNAPETDNARWRPMASGMVALRFLLTYFLASGPEEHARFSLRAILATRATRLGDDSESIFWKFFSYLDSRSRFAVNESVLFRESFQSVFEFDRSWKITKCDQF